MEAGSFGPFRRTQEPTRWLFSKQHDDQPAASGARQAQHVALDSEEREASMHTPGADLQHLLSKAQSTAGARASKETLVEVSAQAPRFHGSGAAAFNVGGGKASKYQPAPQFDYDLETGHKRSQAESVDPAYTPSGLSRQFPLRDMSATRTSPSSNLSKLQRQGSAFHLLQGDNRLSSDSLARDLGPASQTQRQDAPAVASRQLHRRLSDAAIEPLSLRQSHSNIQTRVPLGGPKADRTAHAANGAAGTAQWNMPTQHQTYLSSESTPKQKRALNPLSTKPAADTPVQSQLVVEIVRELSVLLVNQPGVDLNAAALDLAKQYAKQSATLALIRRILTDNPQLEVGEVTDAVINQVRLEEASLASKLAAENPQAVPDNSSSPVAPKPKKKKRVSSESGPLPFGGQPIRELVKAQSGSGAATILHADETLADALSPQSSRYRSSHAPADAHVQRSERDHVQPRSSCECGRNTPSYQLPGDREQRWCCRCPNLPVQAVRIETEQRAIQT